MTDDKKYQEWKEYTNELKKIRSEVDAILEEGNDYEIKRAAKHYTKKANLIFVKRNMLRLTIIPLIDIPNIEYRKQNIDLIDLNTRKDSREVLKEVLQKIMLKIEET